MKTPRRLLLFTDRYPVLGPAVWILSIQYYLVQLAAGLHFSGAFSLRFNTISDLGNTTCGLYSDRFVCSPLHNLMNLSFITLGITMAVGSLLIYQEFREHTAPLTGFTLMALAGFGTILVGLFPENTISQLHILGAALPFVLGNIALIVLGLALKVPAWLRISSVVAGAVALVALVFFLTKHHGFLGSGGVERIVAYPQTIWLILFGLYISKSHLAKRSVLPNA